MSLSQVLRVIFLLSKILSCAQGFIVSSFDVVRPDVNFPHLLPKALRQLGDKVNRASEVPSPTKEALDARTRTPESPNSAELPPETQEFLRALMKEKKGEESQGRSYLFLLALGFVLVGICVTCVVFVAT